MICQTHNPFGSDAAQTYSFQYQPRVGAVPAFLYPWYTGDFTGARPTLLPTGVQITGGQGGITQIPGSILGFPSTHNGTLTPFKFVAPTIPPIANGTSSVIRTADQVFVTLGGNDTKGECVIYSRTLIKNHTVSGPQFVNGSSVFVANVSASEPLTYTCQSGGREHTGQSLPHTPYYTTLIGMLENETLTGWTGSSEYLGLGIMGVLGLLSCMVGFSRTYIARGAVVFIIGISVMGWIGILSLSEALFSGVIVIVILAVFQRRT